MSLRKSNSWSLKLEKEMNKRMELKLTSPSILDHPEILIKPLSITSSEAVSKSTTNGSVSASTSSSNNSSCSSKFISQLLCSPLHSVKDLKILYELLNVMNDDIKDRLTHTIMSIHLKYLQFLIESLQNYKKVKIWKRSLKLTEECRILLQSFSLIIEQFIIFEQHLLTKNGGDSNGLIKEREPQIETTEFDFDEDEQFYTPKSNNFTLRQSVVDLCNNKELKSLDSGKIECEVIGIPRFTKEKSAFKDISLPHNIYEMPFHRGVGPTMDIVKEEEEEEEEEEEYINRKSFTVR